MDPLLQFCSLCSAGAETAQLVTSDIEPQRCVCAACVARAADLFLLRDQSAWLVRDLLDRVPPNETETMGEYLSRLVGANRKSTQPTVA